MSKRNLRTVSLFSNCGAGDLGYAKAGFQFDVMAELDPRRLEVCKLNHPNAIGVVGDLRETWGTVVQQYQKKSSGCRLTMLAACPPCQGMSTARSHRGSGDDPDAGMFDERNLLVTIIAKVAIALMPKIIVVENVQAFLTRKVRHPRTQFPISAAKFLIDELADDYVAFPFVGDLCNFGVPQTRRRSFLTFFHKSEHGLKNLISENKVPYPCESHRDSTSRPPITLRSALSRMALPALDASSAKRATSPIAGGLHSVPIWEDQRYPMVAAIPRHSGKSAWENNICADCGEVDVTDAAATCPNCSAPLLRPVIKSSNGKYRLVNGFRSSTYRRMKSDKPAATITTATGHIGSNHTIHPYQNRLLSTLECALLQTLPRNFNWGDSLEKWGHTNVRAMIGEAVPPLFTLKHGRVLKAVLEGKLTPAMLKEESELHQRAKKKLELG